MKSAKTIVIAASVVFAAVCLGAYSDERDDAAGAKVVPTAPVRAARTPAGPSQVIEEEAPILKPPAPIPNQAARPVRTTPSRTPTRRPTTPSRTTPTRPSAVRTTPGRRVRPPEDPHKNSNIQLEAFMVQVRRSALRSLDVPQISECCKSVSAEHIIKLMKTTDAAVVTAGAKVVVSQNSKAETKSTTRQSILTGPTDKKVVRREYVNVGTSFTAKAQILSGGKIYANLEFEHITIEESDSEGDTGTFVERSWTSAIRLQPGKPTLVGATQEKEQAVFLIVTAHIKD